MKHYFPGIDLLKFLSCIGIVSIHARPFEYMPMVEVVYSRVLYIYVAIFFVLSSFLLGNRLKYDNSDVLRLFKFSRRLLLLYLSWTVILSPIWVSSLIINYPNNWFCLLLPKIIICGAPLGSWFVLSLFYAVFIVYAANRMFNKYLCIFIFLLIELYTYVTRSELLPDFFNLYVKDGIFDSFFLPNRAVFWVNVGFLLGKHYMDVDAFIQKSGPILKASLILVLGVVLSFDGFVNIFSSIVLTILICIFAINKKSSKIRESYLIIIRKMSIVIYFFHFVCVVVIRYIVIYLHEYEYGIREFIITLIISIVVSYIIVITSNKIKIFKYLY